ncbi:flagellar hook-basal body complex protein FliE [Spongiibacter sp.]|uniref:flagellar hook-basal body complex protein FliE n=1 Tax=Spongiibacter sp. TaxID=2024860 RepID=UPI00356A0B42
MSDGMQVDSILNQIRALRQQSPLGPLEAPAASDAVAETPKVDFGQMMKQSLDNINASQKHAGQLAAAFERGDADVSIAQVMVNMQKAQVSFKAAVEVRNKLVDAYKEVMRMSI